MSTALSPLFSSAIAYPGPSDDLSGYDTEDDSNLPTFTVSAPPRTTPVSDPFEHPLVALIKELSNQTLAARFSQGVLVPVTFPGSLPVVSTSEVTFNPPLFLNYPDTIKAAKKMCLRLQTIGFSGKLTIKQTHPHYDHVLKVHKPRSCKSTYARSNPQ